MTIIEAVSATDNLLSKSLAASPKPLLRMTEHLSTSKGKGIRAQILLNSAMGKDGEIHHDAPKAAAAVELLHMATLVHDDVIDNAPVRRNIETLNVKFGNKEAVICGDYLLCVALGVISDIACDDYSKYTNLIPSMTKTISKICEGECRQIFENKNTDLSFSDYLRIITGKTACLFYLSAYAGAVIGGCDEKETKSLAGFGQYLGMLFQISDDIKDYEQSEDQAKKPVKHDIAQGSVTLPLILALRKNQSLARVAREIMQNSKDPAPLVREVISTGALSDSKAVAERYRLKAKKCIGNIENETKRESLIKILEQI